MEPSPLIDTAYLTLRSPLSRPPSLVGLEVVFLACAALTVLHARKDYRAGDGSSLFTWLCIFTYGVTIEILSYNFLDNFTHGQFTVMLYHQKLPLYVSVLYPVYIYTSIKTAERLRLSRLAEPLVVGLFIVVMDFPFDVLGPQAGWWTWSDKDPNLAFRWLGVPVTSYYWHVAFGAVMAFLTRSLKARTAELGHRGGASPFRFWKLLLAAPVTLSTLVLGVIVFLPFHGLKALGVSDGAIVAGLLSGALLLLVVAKKDVRPEPDRLLRWIPILYHPFFVLVALSMAGSGQAEMWTSTLAIALLAAAFAAGVQLFLGKKGAASLSPA